MRFAFRRQLLRVEGSKAIGCQDKLFQSSPSVGSVRFRMAVEKGELVVVRHSFGGRDDEEPFEFISREYREPLRDERGSVIRLFVR